MGQQYKNLKEAFGKNLNINITQDKVKQIERYCVLWEIHKDHPLTLNSSYLGIDKVSFVNDIDGQYLFNMFNTTEREVYAVIKDTETMDIHLNVATNPYNLFVIWVVYKTMHSALSASDKDIIIFNILKMLHYKFFSGRIRKQFPHPPDRATLDYTLAELDNKSDIVRYKTWKKVVEANVREVMDKNSKHNDILKAFGPDDKIRYVITDIYGKTGSRIKVLARAFYLNDEHDKTIKSSKLVSEIDGDKVIRNISGLENLLMSMHTQLISTTAFLDQTDIKTTISINRKTRSEMLQNVLMRLSDLALQQTRMDKYDDIKKTSNGEVIVNIRKLVNDLLLTIYNSCMVDKVDTKKPLRVIEKAFNLMQSSQIKDERVLLVKRSLDHFIIGLEVSRRPATNVSLRMAVITYILLRSFKFVIN